MSRSRFALYLVAVVGLAACSSGTAPPTWTFTPIAAPSSAPVTSPVASPVASPITSAAPSEAAATTITLSEWKVDLASIAKAGKTTFKISNAGTIPHELLIFKSDLAPSAYPTDPAGDIIEDGAGVALLSDGDNIDPGGAQDRTVDLTPGTYLFVCNIPGHFKDGMFTVVTVTK
jgi:uncharacterized cupredoxin-like copper-binding protein